MSDITASFAVGFIFATCPQEVVVALASIWPVVAKPTMEVVSNESANY